MESAAEIYKGTDILRHYIKDDGVIQLSDEKIAVCSYYQNTDLTLYLNKGEFNGKWNHKSATWINS